MDSLREAMRGGLHKLPIDRRKPMPRSLRLFDGGINSSLDIETCTKARNCLYLDVARKQEELWERVWGVGAI